VPHLGWVILICLVSIRVACHVRPERGGRKKVNFTFKSTLPPPISLIMARKGFNVLVNDTDRGKNFKNPQVRGKTKRHRGKPPLTVAVS